VDDQTASVVPSGRLLQLRPDQLKPNPNNPRRLFDPEPLRELKENIRQHGVLVPITVYQLKAQEKFAILDGERRYKCCVELQDEGLQIRIPANVVEQPTKVAGLLYMFSIHNFREQWELMPVAYSLRVVMRELGEDNAIKLSKLTGLGAKQIERCKKLLDFPEEFQQLSLDPDPTQRIPANFWIELHPVLALYEQHLPDVVEELGRNGITNRMVEKYRSGGVKSVIHFRRILEAFEINEEQKSTLVNTLRRYVAEPALETREAFDGFLAPKRGRIQNAIKACEGFIEQLEKARLDFATEDRQTLIAKLNHVRNYVISLVDRLEGGDAADDENTS